MKKILLIAGGFVIVLIIALAAIPVFFKDSIIALVKTQANEALTADVNFTDADVSLLRSFPHLYLSLDSFSIVNRTPANDTLVAITSVGVAIDLWSYIGNGTLDILSATFAEPRVYARVYKDSTVNWNIVPEEPATGQAPASGGTTGMTIALRDYSIENGTIVYEDEPGDKMLMLRNLHHTGSGDFADELFTLETETKGVVVFRKGNMEYLSNVDATWDADLAMDMKNRKFTFKENNLLLNNLPIQFQGWIALPEEGIQMDMSFKAVKTEFKNFLSLVPTIYANNYKELKSSGTMALEGAVKGVMTDDLVPGFFVKLLVGNGMFQYPDLPHPVTNVQMDMVMNNPGGSADRTVVDVRRLHVEIGGDPFDMRMITKTPISDPYIDAAVKGRLNLDALSKSMPLEEGTELGGVVIADVQAKGHLSALESKQYSRFTAMGAVVAQNIVYAKPDLPERVVVHSANLAFSPQSASLKNLVMALGKSDIRGEGRVDNVIGYMLADQELRGIVVLESNSMNLNPWLGLPQNGGGEKARNASATVSTQQKTDLPDNVDFSMTARMKEVLYDNLNLRNVQASLTLKNKVMTLHSSSMELLGGTMAMKGVYDARIPERPTSDFAMSIKNFSIAESFDKLTTLQAFVPFLAYMQGRFDASASFGAELNDEMRPVLPTVESLGGLIVENIRVEGFKPFSEISSLLKISELNNPTLKGLTPKYEIKKGRFILSPMAMKLGAYPATIAGSNGLDKTLDYTMTITLPAGKAKQQTVTALGKLLKTPINTANTSSVDVAVHITGTPDNPKITTSLASLVQGQVEEVTNAVEDAAKQRIDEERQKLEQKAKEAETVARKKVEEEQEKLRQKAREEEERLRQKAREEEEKAKKKLEDELKKRSPFSRP